MVGWVLFYGQGRVLVYGPCFGRSLEYDEVSMARSRRGLTFDTMARKHAPTVSWTASVSDNFGDKVTKQLHTRSHVIS